MTMLISAEANITDDERRRRLYDGEVFNLPPRASVPRAHRLRVGAHRRGLRRPGPDPGLRTPPGRGVRGDPRSAQDRLHAPSALQGAPHRRARRPGLRPEKTYFDVPKLRVVTPASYLTAGLGYNYKPHRDTWYSAPPCQVNWWAPIRGLTPRAAWPSTPTSGDAPPNTSGVRRLRVESLRAPRRGALRHQRSAAAPSPARWKSRRRGPAPG